MRLTLRTLLAWLDNVLPAGEQKQLGEKVTASPVAQQLVDRIRLVVERPQVGAPRPDGRGLAADANSVAEYLDNTLEPERLEPLERICLESDMHLAEVAACHTLLAELAEDPSVVMPLDQAGRSRLLQALGHLPQQQTPSPAKPTVRPAEPGRAALPAQAGCPVAGLAGRRGGVGDAGGTGALLRLGRGPAALGTAGSCARGCAAGRGSCSGRRNGGG